MKFGVQQINFNQIFSFLIKLVFFFFFYNKINYFVILKTIFYNV